MAEDITKKSIDLTDIGWQQAVQAVLDDIVLFDNISDAINFYNNLYDIFIKYHEKNLLSIELVNIYRRMIALSGWVAISSLREDQIIDIINNNFLDILTNEEIDIWEKLLTKLRTILILEDRDDFKEKIKLSLKKNNSVLTKSNLMLDGKDVPGIIANWLKYYEVLYKKKGKALFEEILDNDQYIRTLLQEEKNYLRKLFDFYKKLGYSSFSFEGIEDIIFVDDGEERGWFRQGVYTSEKFFEKAGLKIKNADNILKKALGDDYNKFFSQSTTQDVYSKTEVGRLSINGDILLKNYKLNTINLKEILALKDQYDQKNKPAIKFEIFHQVINDKAKENIFAFLMSLAGFGYLDEIFERDEKIKDIFKNHLAKKFSEKIANHFAKNLRKPVYLSYFLQHILKDILKLDDNESAVLAIKLVNELKRAGDKQYLPIAYGDLPAGVFKWKGIIEKDDRLELAD